ncbi:DNA-binding NarL/FixJ family response regulator [Spinactinospora alkalitolerans]|uniref:DNA-binding NarL/FixJ family response regulator n=1 Tax=Spinactinospora alkalitolerans TaxID=687207 RepID=A0A852U2N4_9ACTN|nr:LuxR C-terminal-related transcriptional regulator [Spinactinospora alkalitolerans]NYE50401.1 DNA-binding NarL/FixJ family response regulator [Spinactinospora alkalitolerans]
MSITDERAEDDDGGEARTARCPNVLIVDDHELLSTTMELALRAQGIAAVRAPVLGADAVRRSAADLAPGLVLLDLDLGTGAEGESLDGVPLAREFHADGWLVLILTGTTGRDRIAAAVAAGAIGWMPKSAPFPDLIQTILDAVAGRPVMSGQERERLMTEHRDAVARRRAESRLMGLLTAREHEILDALVDGRRAAAIAADSFVAISTVRSQIRSILAKLEVTSQLEAVALARSLRR